MYCGLSLFFRNNIIFPIQTYCLMFKKELESLNFMIWYNVFIYYIFIVSLNYILYFIIIFRILIKLKVLIT